jgi:hypothetical protein
MANLFGSESFNTINKGDHVRIVGRDDLKGLQGIVVSINTQITQSQHIYSVELEATGDIIQRYHSNLKRYFPSVGR